MALQRVADKGASPKPRRVVVTTKPTEATPVALATITRPSTAATVRSRAAIQIHHPGTLLGPSGPRSLP